MFQGRLPRADEGEGRAATWSRVLRGGFPEACERSTARAAAWFDSYVELLLLRDVRDLAHVEGISLLPRLLELLAARAGRLLNVAELARTAGIPQTTLKRYLALLEAVFLVLRVPAWAANPTKRLAKSPKVLFADSGLLARIARIDAGIVRERPGLAGPLLESFVGMELLKQIGWSSGGHRLHHFRTAAGREVDFVIEDARHRLVGVEVKSATSVTGGDLRGLEALADAAGESFHRGVVLYAGTEQAAFGPRMHSLPIDALWRLGARPVRAPLPAG